jgi:hypothetical protein
MRFPRVKIWRLMMAVAGVAVFLGFAVLAWRSHQLSEFKRQCVFRDYADLTKDYGDLTKTPLAQSPYLRDVAEPIRIVSGFRAAGSDNDTMGLTFVDARDVQRKAIFAFYSYAKGDIYNTLLLGQKSVTPSGPEEHAFVGLLQRWYLRDAEAQAFYDHLKRSDLSKLTELQNGKVMGVAMLREILMRK